MSKKWTESLKKTKPFTIKGLQVNYILEKRIIIFFKEMKLDCVHTENQKMDTER